MDMTSARTFLAIAQSGSFAAAAEKLNVTQTAVSARVHALEELLGHSLFVRNKKGARLTVAGERFFRHAVALVQTWENARQQIAMPAGRAESVSVGAELSLWDPALTDCLVAMRSERPDVVIRAEVDTAGRLLERIRQGRLDVGVMHNPASQPELAVELLCEEKLVLVTTDPDGRVNPDTYISVDWGPAFAVSVQAIGVVPVNPAIAIDFGPLARKYMLAVGGSGYFRLGAVQPYVERGRLHRVAGAAEFSHSIYLVYAGRDDMAMIELVRDTLRACCARQ